MRSLTPKVKIVTDSTASLEPGIIEKYDIRVVPLKVIFGDEVYSEGVDITNDEFYQRAGTYEFSPYVSGLYRELAEATYSPATSQPSAGDFTQVYSELAQRGHPILSVHISSKLSGTLNSALAAKNVLPQAQIEIMDSSSIAMGMLVAPAAEAAERGQTLPQIKASVEELNTCLNVVGTFNTLEYLRKGGRIGAARALVGTLLGIKPVLTFHEGEVHILAKPRTIARAIEYMLKFVAKRIEGSAPLRGWIAHTRVFEAASVLEKGLRDRFDWYELRLFELGPVLGTHMGPGFIGLGFYGDEDWQSKRGNV